MQLLDPSSSKGGTDFLILVPVVASTTTPLEEGARAMILGEPEA